MSEMTMTLIEEPLIGDDPTPPAPTAEPVAKRVLLVWDAPNLDMGLGAILGGRPTAATCCSVCLLQAIPPISSRLRWPPGNRE